MCEDSDSANDVKVKGTVVFKGTEYSDVCAEQGLSVKQYFCASGKLRNFVKRCSGETRCMQGVCV